MRNVSDKRISYGTAVRTAKRIAGKYSNMVDEELALAMLSVLVSELFDGRPSYPEVTEDIKSSDPYDGSEEYGYAEAVADAADEVLWASKGDETLRDEYIRLAARIVADIYSERPVEVRGDITDMADLMASQL